MKTLHSLNTARNNCNKSKRKLTEAEGEYKQKLNEYQKLVLATSYMCSTLKELHAVDAGKWSCSSTEWTTIAANKRKVLIILINKAKKYDDFISLSEDSIFCNICDVLLARWILFINTPNQAFELARRYRKEEFVRLFLSNEKFLNFFNLAVSQKLTAAKDADETITILRENIVLVQTSAPKLIENTLLKLMPSDPKDGDLFSGTVRALINHFCEEFPNSEISHLWSKMPSSITRKLL